MANRATVEKQWFVVDAENQTLGRLASKVAKIIRGKHKPTFTPHVDCGDHVIILNADKIRLTGNKWDQKEYQRYSGYPGGQYITGAREKMAKHPTFMVENAVKGMIPKNRLGSVVIKNLHVFAGTEHPHEAQKPTALDLSTIK